MNSVSTFRLYLMRAMYAVIAFGMGSYIWRAALHHGHLDMWHGVGVSMLAALALFAAVGIRYPVQMLPFLLFEFAWKVIFVLAFALPLLRTGQIDAANHQTMVECLLGVVLCPLVIPWGYVWRNYVKRPGDRWRGREASAVVGATG